MNESLMDYNGVPDKYWSYAIQHAVEIHKKDVASDNQLPTPQEQELTHWVCGSLHDPSLIVQKSD